MKYFTREKVAPPFLSIGWYGHAMFLLEDDKGIRVVTDPYDPSIGYAFPDIKADVVLVSHDHYDHNNAAAVGGNPSVLRGAGIAEAAGMTFTGITTFHDQSSGSERGSNIVFRWEMGGLSIAHLGDLGHELSPDQAEQLRGLDVMMLPVGGTFTIDDEQAYRLVRLLEPRLVVPMHYLTKMLSFPIRGVEPFSSRFDVVHEWGSDFAYLSREILPDKTQVLVLDYIS